MRPLSFFFGSFLHVEIITYTLVSNLRLFKESFMMAHLGFEKQTQ